MKHDKYKRSHSPSQWPGNIQPGASQPGASQPGTIQPGASQPGACQAGASQPGASQPGQPWAMPYPAQADAALSDPQFWAAAQSGVMSQYAPGDPAQFTAPLTAQPGCAPDAMSQPDAATGYAAQSAPQTPYPVQPGTQPGTQPAVQPQLPAMPQPGYASGDPTQFTVQPAPQSAMFPDLQPQLTAPGQTTVPEAGGHAKAVVQRMMQQAGQLKAALPDFDLGQAMQNPRFVRLVAAGMEVSEAYLAANADLFLRRAFDLGMRQGDRQAQSRMNRQRPVENGAAPAGVVTALDPAHLSRTQRQEIRRRVRCGESVTF